MAIQTYIIPRADFIGDGTTVVYNVLFRLFSTSDCDVYLGGVLQTLNVDYVVAINGTSGGTYTFTTAPGNGVAVAIVSDTPITREADIIVGGVFSEDSFNVAEDRQTRNIQDVDTKIQRSIRLSPAEAVGTLDELPLIVANTRVGFDRNKALGLFPDTGLVFRGNWLPSTLYRQGEVVIGDGTLNYYVAAVRHTSSLSFANDVTDGKWGDQAFLDLDDIVGVGVPVGGTSGQVLTKDRSADFDTSWTTPPGGVSISDPHTWTAAQIIQIGSGVPLTLQLDDNGAGGGPILRLDRNRASPAASDAIGQVNFRAMDRGGTQTNYAVLQGQIIDPTDTSEDGALNVLTTIAGSQTTRFTIGGGLYARGLTDPGDGKINVNDVQIGGVALSSLFPGASNAITALAALTPSAGTFPSFTGTTTAQLNTITATALSLLDDSSTAAMLTTLGAQGLNANLTALSGVNGTASTIPYFTSSGTMTLTDFTPAARTLLDDINVSFMRTTLGLAIGTDVMAYSSNLSTISGYTPATLVRSDIGNTFTTAQAITSASTGNLLTLTNSDAGSGASPALELARTSASPAAADRIGFITFSGMDSGGSSQIYIQLIGAIDDPTATSEDGHLRVLTCQAGTMTLCATLGQGLAMGGSLTDPGTGKINATDYQINGVSIIGGKQVIPIPAAAMYTRTTAGASSGRTETATNKIMMQTWDFDTTTQEHIQFSIPMPTSWNGGTVTAKFHFMGVSGTGTARFGIQAVALSPAELVDTAFGTAVTSTALTISTLSAHYVRAETSAMTIASSPSGGDWVIFQIYRNVSGDTFSGDVRLVAVEIFYTSTRLTET